MTQLLPWSYSRLDAFKKCRKMFYHQTVAKDVPFEESDQMKWGNRVHKALEYRVRDNVPLSGEFAQFECIAAAIQRAPGTNLCEYKITLNPSLQPTGWFEKDAYIRVIVDVLKINGQVGFMGDYKTGKMKFDELQLKLFAAAGFQAFPDIQQWTTAYVWTQDKIIDPKVYSRAQLPTLWVELLAEARQIQEAYEANQWPAKPGWSCGYCSANKYRKCEFAASPYKGQ